MGLGFVPNIFFPDNDKPIFYAELELPTGTPLRKTEAVVSQIEQFVNDSIMADTTAGQEGVKDFTSYIGMPRVTSHQHDEIGNITVEMTILGGNIVYQNKT